MHIYTTADRLWCGAPRSQASVLASYIVANPGVTDAPFAKRNKVYRTSHQLHDHLYTIGTCACVFACPAPARGVIDIDLARGEGRKNVNGDWVGHARPWVECNEVADWLFPPDP